MANANTSANSAHRLDPSYSIATPPDLRHCGRFGAGPAGAAA